jgi:hypothetical protein
MKCIISILQWITGLTPRYDIETNKWQPKAVDPRWIWDEREKCWMRCRYSPSEHQRPAMTDQKAESTLSRREDILHHYHDNPEPENRKFDVAGDS